MIETTPITLDRIDDLAKLLGADATADRCWCMWFIIPYKAFQANGRDGNHLLFVQHTTGDNHSMGLIAYLRDQPVGWCAVGPRSRYARAVKTPTLAVRDGDDATTWLVPCLFVHPDHRGHKVAAALLTAAVDHATAAGADAIEGFPLAGDRKRRSGSDLMVGNEALFVAAGFEPRDRPSDARVVMRRVLTRNQR